jgi:hypothetical protein
MCSISYIDIIYDEFMRLGGKDMKGIKIVGMTAVGYLLTMQQALAVEDCQTSFVGCNGNGHVVPEMDGSGAIIAIGLVVGLVALFREKFYNK